MEKPFFEVFPSLQLKKEMEAEFRDAVVSRVAMTRDHSTLRVYLSCTHLIHAQKLDRCEQEIAQQLFPAKAIRVYLIASFMLSEQYRLASLWELYEDSILWELKTRRILLYELYRSAEKEFLSKDQLLLKIPTTIVAEESAEDLVRVLEEIALKRCGLEGTLDYELTDPPEKKKRPAAIISIADARPKDVPPAKPLEESVEAPAEMSPDAAEKPKEKSKEKKPWKKGTPKEDHPDLLYGRYFNDEPIAIEEVMESHASVTVRGRIIKNEVKELRKKDLALLILHVTDNTDTIACNLFVPTEEVKLLAKSLSPGSFVLLKGVPQVSLYSKELEFNHVVGIRQYQDFFEKRTDEALEKRVELHCHTKMSDMDAVSDVKDIIKQVHAWGHKAMAITDHGVVQAFTEGFHACPPDFKLIYGVEAYLVDDVIDLVKNPKDQTLDSDFVVFDIETTGLSKQKDKIIEIGAVKIRAGKITDRFSEFVNPYQPISFQTTELTSITDADVCNAPGIEEILPNFMAFCADSVLVAHNAEFDTGFIRKNCRDLNLPYDYTVADTMTLSQLMLPHLKNYKLDTVAKALNAELEQHHRAVYDAECTAHIFLALLERLKERGVSAVAEINTLKDAGADRVKRLRSHHAILLAKNDIGRVNLYRLVSLSHLTYFYRRPLIPKSELIKYREGLILGSACEAGELYQALLNGAETEELTRIVEFYDYLEIQPLGNNRFLIEDERSPIENEEDLKDMNRRIVALGKEFSKPVVATCDVHFLNPEDEVYRMIIQAGNGFKDAESQAPLYFHTTEEMLAEFDYLGSDTAYDVVVKNTNMIADMCERIEPVRPDKCPPVIADSDKTLRRICETKAREIYGDPLPAVVKNRLDRELNSIIGNGYAVMYIIAQKLVWKSNEDGYLVGSRGSVGSSFAATMAGITEVNPLHAHYYCPACHYSDFDSEEVRAFDGRAGCDMPDKNCPVCGEPLKKDGFDIPFETFLGFKGNKEPDIDLNFSGDYQSKAHAYTEVIFGHGQTYRAGTITGVAEKTAFGYVKNFYEERGIRKRTCEIERVSEGCVGIRKSTGQHPGGIIVLPVGEEINTFTPIQKPANKMEADSVTTHFDYHSIDHNLLKLDILGHDDPTMIKRLEELTGIDALQIPLDDPKVMSLFQDTSALEISPEDIGGCPCGAMGLPEFGTDNAINMLMETKPKEFSDLVRISGLSHGTGVYSGNAQDLIKAGTATISTAICTRDDIMTYLINKGLEAADAFDIMEAVRKGKVAKGGVKKWPEWKEDMKAHDVPEWYIKSCEKIEYMFPKAHAAAYVMMAWRIAYCKVYHPLAYYAAYFSIRADAFSYELMCQGPAVLKRNLAELRARSDKLTVKEKDTFTVLRLVEEMYARGYEFMPIDLYRAHARYFQIFDGKIMPSFASIDKMGGEAAASIPEAVKQGPFLSRQDFKNRTKVTQTVIDKMQEMGLFRDIPETDQMSLSDIFAM